MCADERKNNDIFTLKYIESPNVAVYVHTPIACKFTLERVHSKLRGCGVYQEESEALVKLLLES